MIRQIRQGISENLKRIDKEPETLKLNFKKTMPLFFLKKGAL